MFWRYVACSAVIGLVMLRLRECHCRIFWVKSLALVDLGKRSRPTLSLAQPLRSVRWDAASKVLEKNIKFVMG